MVELPIEEANLKLPPATLHDSTFDSHVQSLFDVADTELPRISVVIPSIIGRVDELAIALESLRDLDYPDYEIVVVDNRRSIPVDDPLPALVGERPWVRVVRESRPGISAARNAGVKHSSGDIIAFTDDDVRVDRGWLRALGARFALDSSLGAVTGLILPAELESPAQVWFERYYGGFGAERSFEALTIEPDTSYRSILRGSRVLARNVVDKPVKQFAVYGVGTYGAGANMAFRRSAFETISDFDVALGVGTPARGGEDLAALIDVLWKGGSIGYEPAAFVHHRHRREYDELVHQLDGYGLGFGAMLTSLVWHDKRHLACMLAHVPLVTTRLVKGAFAHVPGANPKASGQPAGPRPVASYPRALIRRDLRSWPRGPFAYARSRRFWREAAGTSAP
jgi:glycosyltransferase involved in cell wall biosynthesis